MTQTDKVFSRKDGNVGTLVFNNPERHNAMSLEMWEGCTRAMDGFAADPEIRVVVLTRGLQAFTRRRHLEVRRRARLGGRRAALQRRGGSRLCQRPRIPEADHRHDPRLLRRRRHGDRELLRPAHLFRGRALRRAGRQARPRLRLRRRQAADRPGRPLLHQGDLLHRAPVQRHGGGRDGAGQPHGGEPRAGILRQGLRRHDRGQRAARWTRSSSSSARR